VRGEENYGDRIWAEISEKVLDFMGRNIEAGKLVHTAAMTATLASLLWAMNTR
jgi:hypothetical protein